MQLNKCQDGQKTETISPPKLLFNLKRTSQPAFSCSKSSKETPEQQAESVQS